MKHIATIHTGFFDKPENEGEFIYLQMKDFDDEGILNQAVFSQLKAGKITEKHILKEGDILFAAKGTKNFAACFRRLNYPTVASTSFFVIRLHNKIILPEYLTWFLNHPNTMEKLESGAVGTSIVSISKVVLGDLEIAVPEINIQKKVLMISTLQHKEKSLKQQIDLLKDKVIQYRIFDAINID